eukprot:3055983-Pleurochrysis_carterae.AAC.2
MGYMLTEWNRRAARRSHGAAPLTAGAQRRGYVNGWTMKGGLGSGRADTLRRALRARSLRRASAGWRTDHARAAQKGKVWSGRGARSSARSIQVPSWASECGYEGCAQPR